MPKFCLQMSQLMNAHILEALYLFTTLQSLGSMHQVIFVGLAGCIKNGFALAQIGVANMSNTTLCL